MAYKPVGADENGKFPPRVDAAYASGGVHFIISDTAPGQTTVNGKPVVWINTNATPLTPVTATAPTFADLSGTGSDTYTIPTTTGVDYKVAGVTKAAGTYVGTGSVTVTAVAKTGYTLTGTATWSNTFSATVTDPYPLHAVYDTFTAADGTAIVGRVTEKGALTWAVGSAYSVGGTYDYATTITGGKIVNSSPTTKTYENALTLAQGNAEVTIDYDLTTGTDTAGSRRAHLFINAATGADTLSVYLDGAGGLTCYKGGVNLLTLTGTTTGHPQTGAMTLRYVDGTITVLVNDVSAATASAIGTGYTGTGRKAGFAAKGNSAKLDNFRVKYL